MEFYSLGVMLKSAPDRTPVVAIPFTPIPPLPALTTLEVTLTPRPVYLTARLANLLSLIHSAPILSSVVFRNLYCSIAEDPRLPYVWVDVDNKLAQLAMQVKTKRNLTVVLEVDENTKWEEYFPEFRRTGGQLVMGEILQPL